MAPIPSSKSGGQLKGGYGFYPVLAKTLSAVRKKTNASNTSAAIDASKLNRIRIMDAMQTPCAMVK